MAGLITISEVKTLAIVNAGFDVNLIKDNIIEQAQVDNLKPILSDNLYYAVVASPSSYTALISGETYTNSEGRTVVYRGLKNFIAYATMAGMFDFLFATPAKGGIIRPNTETSNNSTEQEFDKAKNFYFKKMQNCIDEIKMYLSDKYDGNELYTQSQDKKFYGGILL